MDVAQSGEENIQTIGDYNTIMVFKADRRKSEFNNKLELIAKAELWGLNLMLYGIWCLYYISLLSYNVKVYGAMIHFNALELASIPLSLLFLFMLRYMIRKHKNIDVKVYTDRVNYMGKIYNFSDYILVKSNKSDKSLFVKSPKGEARLDFNRVSDVDALIQVYNRYKI